MCYTSGTTGQPAGRRLLAPRDRRPDAAQLLGNALPLTDSDVVLPVVPMFHANAWGFPFACTLIGAKQVFPGPTSTRRACSTPSSSTESR